MPSLVCALRLRYIPPMTHDYRERYARFYHPEYWAKPGSLQAEARVAQAWDDMRVVMRGEIAEILKIDRYRVAELEERLVARLGEDWYRPVRVEDVCRLLDEI
ncbi:MAG: hypothetical protein PHO89_09635 [Methylacidiphilaceae bacterium]|nr:hypothetical protein [Candidatus Methylacidiphilaceae bacterium]